MAPLGIESHRLVCQRIVAAYSGRSRGRQEPVLSRARLLRAGLPVPTEWRRPMRGYEAEAPSSPTRMCAATTLMFAVTGGTGDVVHSRLREITSQRRRVERSTGCVRAVPRRRQHQAVTLRRTLQSPFPEWNIAPLRLRTASRPAMTSQGILGDTGLRGASPESATDTALRFQTRSSKATSWPSGGRRCDTASVVAAACRIAGRRRCSSISSVHPPSWFILRRTRTRS